MFRRTVLAAGLGDEVQTGFGDDVELAPGDFIQPHRGEWTETDRTAESVTYDLTDPDTYAAAVPLGPWVRSVASDSRLRATLDRETGRLRRLVDTRDPVVDAIDCDGDGSGTTRLTYRIDTEFDRYGDVSAPRPTGDLPVSAVDRLKGLAADIDSY